MPLSHVCVWDADIGYKRISLESACKMYPNGASAKSGYFVCELCAQNVLLTAPGVNVRHFRHDPSSPNKECDERQAHFDPLYGRRLRNLNSHLMPLRITVAKESFALQMGFFCPPDSEARCDKIRITTNSGKAYEYSFERIERGGTTYLNIGETPSREYNLEYINAAADLVKFWPSKVPGISSSGSFFDERTGQILPSGAKAYFGDSYYLLQSKPLGDPPTGLEVSEVLRTKTGSLATWYLYKIQIKRFSEITAKFFLKYAIFLTEHPTKFYPIWPAYIKEPYFIYHNSDQFFFYLDGDDAELRAYPASENLINSTTGRLYKLYARNREQLVAIGKSGALGFSYLIRQPLNRKVVLPSIEVSDYDGNVLDGDSCVKLPKFKSISVFCRYDGKVVIQKHGRINHIYKAVRPNQRIIMLNKGIGDKGFTICCDCGAAMPGDDPSVLKDIMRPYRSKFLRTRCKHNETKNVNLGYDFITDMLVLEIALDRQQVSMDLAKNSWLNRAGQSLAEALRLSACQELDIEFTELVTGFRVRQNQKGDFIDIYLYDSLSSGAGYAVSIEASIQQLLIKTRELLSSCNCDSACHKCLKHYRNQYVHGLLDRSAALDLLTWAEKGVRSPMLPVYEQRNSLQSVEQILQFSGVHIDFDHEPIEAESFHGKKRIVVYPAMWARPTEKNMVFVSDSYLKYAKPYALKTIVGGL